ncbi:MAG TPA: hypothetical protein VMZ92_01250, partial [Planctomycetota bacterium]|nr:hypothetical protein [Planctomycetota bacterium]
MRRSGARILTVSLVVLCSVSVAGADVLKVIPEKSLAAAISRNPRACEEHIRLLAAKLTGEDLPEGILLEQLLRHFGLHHTAAPRDADGNPRQVAPVTTVDCRSPMALVLVTPAMDIPGMPVALVFGTTDYAKCLREIARVLSPTDNPLPVEITEDGTDVIKGEKRSIFAARMDTCMVVADAEYVVKTLKAEAGKPLAGSGLTELNRTYLASDLTVYVNVDEVVKTFGAEITTFKQVMQQQMKNEPGGGGMPGGEQRARMFGAQIDLVMRLLSQIEASCTGVNLGDDGLRLATLYRALPDTALARVAGRVKPLPLTLLSRLDAPAVSMAGWHIAPESLEEVMTFFEEFFVKSGIVGEEDDEKNKAFTASYRKLMDAASGEGAFLWAPPGEGKGLVRLVYLLELKPDVNIRAEVKDYVEKSMDFANVFQGPLKTESRYEQTVETHRGCPIDRITITFQRNPDAPEPMNPNVDMLGIVEAIYGPNVVAYLTQVKSTLVYSVGYPTSDALKAQMDGILDRRAGDLLRSEMYVEAVKGLPAQRSGVMVISPAEAMRLILGRFVGGAGDEGNPLEGFEFEKRSGIGV